MENNLFEVQPEWCRKALPEKELGDIPGYLRRVLQYDPAQLYERISPLIKPYDRNDTINFSIMFPDREDGTCKCGCGRQIPRDSNFWYENECQFVAIMVWNIIRTIPETISLLLTTYQGNSLCYCCKEKEGKQCDHIFPVSKGGSASWLSNYQLLCHTCHKTKTAEDLNYKKSKYRK